MTAAVRPSVRTATTAATAGLTFVKPAGLADGDVLYMMAAATSTSATITPPAGWTLEESRSPGVGFIFYCYRKVIVTASSEAASYTFTWNSTLNSSGTLFAVSGADVSGSPTDVDLSANAANSPADAPSITTTGAGRLVLAALFTNSNDTIATPAGTTSINALANVNVSFKLVDYVQVAAGATGPVTFTGGAGSREVGYQLAVKSANTPPNAPTLTAPANASYVDLAAGGTFTATNNDPDVGDTLSGYALRRKIAGAGSYEYWNASTSAWQSGIVWNSSAALSVTFGSGKWTNGNTYNWSFAAQDALGAQGAFAADNTVNARTPPSVVVNAPTGSIATATPTVSWTDTLPSGAAQTAYRVVVESGSYGTTPGAGTTAYDSGVVAAPSLSAAVPPANALTNAVTYRFFVQVTATGGQTSSWSYSTATVAITPPSTPTLVATAQPSTARVKLDVTAGAGGPGATYYLLQRSADGGATWTYVRGGSPGAPLTYGGTATLYDYEAPPSVALLYRVVAVLITGTNTVPSAASATAAATLTLTSAWLKNPLNPAANVALSCLDSVDATRGRATEVLLPLGARYPVVQSDVRRSRTFTVTTTPTTQAEADAIDALLNLPAAVLMLQRPAVNSGWRGLSLYFVVAGDDSSTSIGQVPHDAASIAFPVVEVAAPVLP